MADLPRVPTADLKTLPDEPWAKTIVASLNDTIEGLAGSSNIEIKDIDITVPDPWVLAAIQGDWDPDSQMRYAKLYDGSVEISGFVQDGTYDTNAFILPAICRPPYNIHLLTPNVSDIAMVDISSSNGAVSVGPSGLTGRTDIHCRFMPASNTPAPLSCFPIDVRTGFKTPPKAVVAIANARWSKDTKTPVNSAGMPIWRFVQTRQGPCVQILDIPGLEYGSRQKVTVVIIGG